MQEQYFYPKPYMIRHHIQSQGLKLWWVAEFTGVHKTTLKRWLSGKISKVREKHLRNLANILEVDWKEISFPISPGETGRPIELQTPSRAGF